MGSMEGGTRVLSARECASGTQYRSSRFLFCCVVQQSFNQSRVTTHPLCLNDSDRIGCGDHHYSTFHRLFHHLLTSHLCDNEKEEAGDS